MLNRIALQHFVDVLRHVGENDAYNDLEYPTVDLKIALLNFNTNMPAPPMVMETNRMLKLKIHCFVYQLKILNQSLTDTKLFSSVKSRVGILMKLYNKQEPNLNDIKESTAMFQKAMIEDYAGNYQQRHQTIDFD